MWAEWGQDSLQKRSFEKRGCRQQADNCENHGQGHTSVGSQRSPVGTQAQTAQLGSHKESLPFCVSLLLRASLDLVRSNSFLCDSSYQASLVWESQDLMLTAAK